jgi:hypothetical protein
MANYYVNRNAQTTGEHEVHQDGCPTPPNHENRHVLGYFLKCQDAVKIAKQTYPNSDGCRNCCPDCHTR